MAADAPGRTWGGQNLKFRGRLGDPARAASGGNQQKLVIGKWVLTGADILIFDEPTRGIDIAAKAEVYRLIHELAGAGAAIILVSSELPELMNVCHRILVMSGGRICDELEQQEFSEPRILAAAFAAHMGGGRGRRVGSIVMLQPPRTRAPSTEEVRDRRLDMLRHYGRQVGLPLVVAALIGLFAATSDVFFSVQNFRNIGVAAAALAAVSFGQTFTILTAGLDLSVGSTVALVSIVGAFAMRNYGVGPGVLAALACGAAAGLVNGLVITKLKVFPFIATLATLSIFSGLALSLSAAAFR